MTSVVALVAQWGLLVPAFLVLLEILRRRRWLFDLAQAAAGGLLTVLFVKVAGALRFETRPFVMHHVQPAVLHVADNAFPSDHLAACGLAFGFLLPRSRRSAALTLLFAALIGAARVLAQLHWPLDIAVGFALGAAAIALASVFVAPGSKTGPAR